MADPTRIEQIFLDALNKGDADRLAFVAEACGADSDLRREVERLLVAQPRVGRFLEEPLSNALSPTEEQRVPSVAIGTLIADRYKLLEEIGEGGMGTVWMAQQTEPVRRTVAVKLIKPGMDSRLVLARFEAERQALALMDHPNIAKVHDAGTTPDGRPYFVMELVKGVPITRYCDEHRLTPRQRLELFVPVCHAIQHAHQKGVIHRDIKPSNVLVALYDDRPVPKVIDFGVAKATGQQLTEETLHTGFGAVVGTVEYMSPEQATFNQLDIDTRSDVYSLGVLLYELLAGSPPFSKNELEQAGMLEMLRVIREQEPSKPSTKLSTAEGLPTLAANRGTEPAKLTKLVRGELDWIVMKALEKDRSRRYETANGFAMDAQRYLADEPVLAGAPSAWYRFRKFARRNRARLAVAAALGFLVLGAGAFAWYADRQAAGRERVEQARLERNAEAVAALLDRCEEALRADRADRAGVALDAAERRAADGGAEELAGRLARCRADLDLLSELDAVDAVRGTPVGGKLPRVRDVVPRWRAALAAYGVSPDGDPATSAGRLNDSLVRDRALTALDLWLWAEPSPWLRALLRVVDQDPYRDAVRDAIAGRDNPAVAALAGRPEALAQPGRFAAALGQHAAVPVERRRAVLQAALLDRPGDLALLVSMANSYAGRRQWAAERVRWLQAAVAAHPESPVAHNNLGTVLDDLKDFDGAIAAYRVAIRLDPQIAAFVHSNLGALLTKMDPDGAIVEFQKAIRLDPNNAGAHTGWGRALAAKKDPEGAIAKYREAIGIDSKYVPARLDLGKALDAKGDVDGAMEQYVEAIRIDRNNASAHTSVGAMLGQKGKPDEALAKFDEAIRIDPDHAMAHTNRGVTLWEMGALEAALVAMRTAVDRDPELALARSNLGAALLNLRELDAGLIELRKAVELEPENAENRRNLAVGLGAKGDLDGAIAELEELIQLDPKDVNARNFLAITLREQGELNRAVSLFQQLVTEMEKGGFRHANAEGIVNDLVVCHERLEQFDQAEAWRRKWVATMKERVGGDSPRYAADLAWLGRYLLRRQNWTEAEAVLRECLAVSERKGPTSWARFDAVSLVGAALLGQKKYGDAERLLRDGYEGLKQREKDMPPKRKAYISEAALRLVQLYDATGKKDEAAKWRALLEQQEGTRVGGVHEVGDGLKLQGKFDGQATTLIYEVKLTAGKTYAIYMARVGRQAIHPSLVLQDTDRRLLAEVETGGLPARLTYRAQRDGVYRIHAASANAGRGEFTLTVREKKDAGKPAAADPKTADDWNVRGAELRARKDLPGAIAAFKKGLAANDKDLDLWHNLALTLSDNKDVPGAIAAYAKAVALDASDAQPHNGLAWLLATCADPKLRDPGRAVTHAKKAVELAPKNPNYPSTLGAAYYRARDWKAAIAALEQSRQMREGGDAHEWFFLAMALWQLGEKDKAREWYERAAKWMEKHQPGSDELRRFQAEAAQVLATEKKD